MPTSSVFFECLRCQSRPIPARCAHCGDNSDNLDVVTSPYSTQLKNTIQKLQTELLSITPEVQAQELRSENQRLTNSLTLKDTELNDLQAEIRALHSQLSERENNQPSQQQIRKLETKLQLVKQKLTHWTQLLTHD